MNEEERKRRHREAQAKYRAKLKTEKERLEEEIERLDKQRIREIGRVTFSTPKSNEKDIGLGNSSETNSKEKEIHSRCEWCGVMKGLDHYRLCEFCRQFKTKERMLLEREWSKVLRELRRTGDSDLISKYRKEFEKTHGLTDKGGEC